MKKENIKNLLQNEIILFENQSVKLEVNMKDETVWLTQEQMGYYLEKQGLQLMSI